MKSRKHIALGLMIIPLIIAVIYMEYLTDTNARQNITDNRYGICINEVCSSYFPVSFAETQPPSDWIELYNFSDTKIDLSGFYLSDDKEDLYKCGLPAVELMPGGYYVIHSECDEMVDGEERLNFKISTQGETLYLSNQDGVIDIVNVPGMDTNTAWSRLTDAGSEWENTELTYRCSNDQAERILKKIKAPAFSVAGGFYSEEFELELSAPSASMIYYTVDGSEPDKGSILYEKPIRIKDVSDEPNVYSARDDFNLLHEYAAETVEKIMVVRAIAIDADGKKSDIVTNSYIIGKEDKRSYGEMYTVSLVTDPYNLFDYNEGIYVLGQGYDDYAATGGSTEDWIQADANYRIKGKRSERPASIEIFDESGSRIFDREVGIRIHGGTTRGCTQKSFSVYAREMYDGKDTIDDLFGDGTTVHKFFLYTNREGTKLRDVLVASTLADRNVATQTFVYCNVFLDGEYWGVYLLAEVYDEYYFKNHYDINQSNIQICERTPPVEVTEYLSTVTDRSKHEVYEKLCQMIDMESFIDYYAAMLYLNDYDWLGYNARTYRSTECSPGTNEDGKWRWGVWDIETAMYDAEVDTFHTGHTGTWDGDILAQTLMEHEEFRAAFVNTYMDLYNNIWNEDSILAVISDLEESIAESYAMHIKRYYEGDSTNEYTDKLKKFFTDRKEYAFDHVKEEFNLSADPVWLVILSNKEGAASYRVNTTVVDIPEAWWQGLYFPDFPIEIKIKEIYDDNEFLGWYTEEGELLSTEDTITIHLDRETNIICPRWNE
ncbi:MAG: hypothetical protein HDR17_04260 [Lachnospiraceae bacterium]|nr:hypothetical protein [Lachnospiraceae bacterium]